LTPYNSLIENNEGKEILSYFKKISLSELGGSGKNFKLNQKILSLQKGGSKNMAEKFYLTKEGLERLKREYEKLKKIKLEKQKGESPAFLHSEDLNLEYVAFKEDMNFLEARLNELEHVLKNYKLISLPPKEKQDTVQIGATVTLEEKDGSLNEFMIVGTMEANPSEGKISWRCPVGKALLGKKVGDEIVVTSPIKVVYKIKEIRYEIS